MQGMQRADNGNGDNHTSPFFCHRRFRNCTLQELILQYIDPMFPAACTSLRKDGSIPSVEWRRERLAHSPEHDNEHSGMVSRELVTKTAC